MTEKPGSSASEPAKAPGLYVPEFPETVRVVPLHEALRAIEERVQAVAQEELARLYPGKTDDGAAAPPEGRVTVRLLALPAECGTEGDRPYSAADPLPPPPPPLAPLFLVVADDADHNDAVACIGAVLSDIARFPLLPWPGEDRFLRVDRVDVGLAETLAIRTAAGLSLQPFALLRVRGLAYSGPPRPERVGLDPEDPDTVLGVKGQIEQTLKKGLHAFVFEPNTPKTWAAVRGMALSVLHEFWREGAFFTKEAEVAYSVRCGLGDTITAEDILNGQLVLVVTMLDEMLEYAELVLTIQMAENSPRE